MSIFLSMFRNFLFFFLLFFCTDLFGQSLLTVRGVVQCRDGIPLSGASIVCSDGLTGTFSDCNGRFELRVGEEVRFLRISHVGYSSFRVRLRDSLFIVLDTVSCPLDESVVTAYRRRGLSLYTGSSVSLPCESFSLRTLTSVSDVFEGLVCGLHTGESSGQPGYMPSLRIRGFGSLNAGSNPLYVVDGSVYRGELCDLNPSDISSVTVLKDASSTALYGSSAGNGVVLLSLHRPSSSRPVFRFTVRQGFSERGIPEYDRVGVMDYLPLEWEMLRNGLVSSGMELSSANLSASSGLYGKVNSNPFLGVGNDEMVLADGRLNPSAGALVYDDLDWSSRLFRKGYRGEYHLSYSHRMDGGGYYASLGYLTEEGYLVHSGLERITARLSSDFRIFRLLSCGISAGLSRSSGNLSNTQDNATDVSNPFYFSRYIGPVYPVHAYDASRGGYLLSAGGDRQYAYSVRGSGSQLEFRNIVEETLRNRNHFSRTRYGGDAFALFTPFFGLTFRLGVSVSGYDYRKEKYVFRGPASSPGRLSALSGRMGSLTLTELLAYRRIFGSHDISFLFGHESYSYRYESFSGNRQDQIVEGVYSLSNFQSLLGLDSYMDSYRKEGYFAELCYGYSGRYELSFSYRRDGSSRFRRGHRWGNFWSAGFSWRMDREFFLRELCCIDYLKFRSSYGETGNDNVQRGTSLPNTFTDEYYPSLTLYTLGENNADEAGMALSSYGNGSLSWETQGMFDAALEFGFFGRIRGSFEYFRKVSRDLLFDVPQVLSSGVSSVWDNVGCVLNRGIEVTFSAVLLRGRFWSWECGVGATFLHNEITRMPSFQPEIVSGTRKLVKGRPLYNHWLREYCGVSPETGDALFRFDSGRYRWNSKVCFVSSFGDSLTYYSNYGRYHDAGSPVPKVYGGLTTRLVWRRLELSGVVSYSLGGKVYNTGYSYLMVNGKYGQSFHRDILRRWQNPGDVTDVPRLDDAVGNKRLGSISSASQANAVSDRWVFSGSYLNIRNVTLLYRFGSSFLRRLGMSGGSVFFSGENLHLFSALKGMDPRQAFKGIITVSNTPARTFTLGLRVEI